MPRPLSRPPFRPAPLRRRRGAVCAALVTVSALLLTGCATNEPLVDDPFSEIINNATGDRPLPPGAYYESADSRSPEERDRAVSNPSPAPGGGTAEDRVPDILDQGRIIIGVDPSLNLMSFRDADGQLTGFEVDLSREIARDIFDDPDRVDFRYVNSGESGDAIREGTVDAVIRSMSATPTRLEIVDFTAPYLTSAAGVLTTMTSGIESTRDLDGRTVCVSSNTTSEEVTRSIAPDSTLLLVQHWGDCLTAIQQHQADAVISDDIILAGFAAQDSSLTIVSQQLTSESYSAAVEKGDDGLVRQINATLERIRADGTWNQIYETWLGPYLPTKPQPMASYAIEEDSVDGEDADSDNGSGSGSDADGGAGDEEESQ